MLPGTRLAEDYSARLAPTESAPASIRREVVDRFKDAFKEELGHIKGHKAKIQLKPDAISQYFRARNVPYALKDRVEKELDRLENEGVIERVSSSDWAAPIVPVVKKDDSIRICGDYKRTMNSAAIVDCYPLPKIEDIFASLSGGKTFTKLDLAHAYNQIELDDEAKHLATINTSIYTIDYHSVWLLLQPSSNEQWKVFCRASQECQST